MLYFNSIKVRLKQNILKEGQIVHLFQFHKGTIKTFEQVVNNMTEGQSFQFHKGTIKTANGLCMKLYSFNFNSIKVRLKLASHTL